MLFCKIERFNCDNQSLYQYLIYAICCKYKGNSVCSTFNTKGINCFLFQYKDNIELLDGFEPPVRQINTRLLYNNQSYQSLYQHNFNYQMFVKKL